MQVIWFYYLVQWVNKWSKLNEVKRNEEDEDVQVTEACFFDGFVQPCIFALFLRAVQIYLGLKIQYYKDKSCKDYNLTENKNKINWLLNKLSHKYYIIF